MADRVKYQDHKGHRSGRDADIRLFRKDRQQAPVTRFDKQYDRDATATLIALFFESHIIQVIYFNDLTIHGSGRWRATTTTSTSPSRNKGIDVKKILAAFALLACGAAFSQNSKVWQFALKPFTGAYSIYGGGLGDPYAPKVGDKKMKFSVDGQIAKEMFNAMGPDLKGVCGAEDGGRIRQRAEVGCSFRTADGYHCDFAFDLTSGRSIGGSVAGAACQPQG